MKGTLKRLLAFGLSVILASQLVTGLIPAAEAADPVTPAPGYSAGGGKQLDFADPDNGRPNLYVDFLGDNWHYQGTTKTTSATDIVAKKGTTISGNGDAAKLSGLAVPGAFDQSNVTNPAKVGTGAAEHETGTGNTWAGYRADGTDSKNYTGSIFWVGVGVDRTQVLKLLDEAADAKTGLFSLELGFYYNSQYIEPYVDGGDYVATITKANIAAAGNPAVGYPGNTTWSDSYLIRHAETDLPVSTEMVTQETVMNPSITAISNNSDWRMTYVSLEMDPAKAAADMRLKGRYDKSFFEDNRPSSADPNKPDGNGVPDGVEGPSHNGIPASATGTDGPEYLMLIPFVYKKHDPYSLLCLRLARNATHFSIGAGSEGVDPYGAWERVTTRNAGHELKLQTRFTGDLNIFTGGKAPEINRQAQLVIINGGGSLNTAIMRVDGDPAIYPVWADKSRETITGLQGGIGMMVDTTVQPGYRVTVTVHLGSDSGDIISHTIVIDQEHYTFVMPDGDVTVVVEFAYTDADQFLVYLTEIQRAWSQAEASDYEAAEKAKDINYDPATDPAYDPKDSGPQNPSNRAKITTTLGAGTAVIQTGDANYTPHPNDGHDPGPADYATPEKTMTIEVFTHADYVAEVRIFDFSEGDRGAFVETGFTPVSGTGITVVNGRAILPHGGKLEFTMHKSDMDVVITYRPADTYKAYLEVWHVSDPIDQNTAQFAYASYDENNVESTAYSKQIYEDYAPDVDANGNGLIDSGEEGHDNHRAVKDPGGISPFVPKSAANLSKSLGGDTGAVGKSWIEKTNLNTGPNAVMSRLYSSANEGDLAAVLNGQDLYTLAVTDSLTGLRKNLAKEPFGDSTADVEAFVRAAWELRNRILLDTSTGGLKDTYVKDVTQTVGSTTSTVFSYLDLSPAQVQAYILELEREEAIARTNQAAYQEMEDLYRKAVATRKRIIEGNEGYADATAPVAPKAPGAITSHDDVVDPAKTPTGVRTYQDSDYTTERFVPATGGDYDLVGSNYVAMTAGTGSYARVPSYKETYLAYINRYQQFVEAIPTASSEGLNYNGITDGSRKDPPTALPARVATPFLSDDATAAVEADKSLATKAVNAVAWNTPAAANSAALPITVRNGRTVSVVLEANSAYELDRIEFHEVTGANNDEAGNRIYTMTYAQSADYQNVYTFSMPNYDCVVQVYYKLRGAATLEWSISGADAKVDNLAKIVAYRITQVGDKADGVNQTPLTVPTRVEADNDAHNKAGLKDALTGTIPDVLCGSTVSVTAKVADGYQVTVTARNKVTGAGITVSERPAADPNDGTVYTFTVPKTTAVTLSIVYSLKSVPKNTATIVGKTFQGDSIAAGNIAIWQGGGNVRTNVPMGEHLVGTITVAPGYYIYSVSADGASGSYPFTLSGDGYNGGYGTGVSGAQVPIEVHTTMPGEDLTVTVVFRKGPPPVEPGMNLTLTVTDEANNGETKDDNWAKATIYHQPSCETYDSTAGATPAHTTALGPCGQGPTVTGTTDPKNPAMFTASTYAEKGDWVVIDLHPADGYYVKSVVAEPSNLGVAITWSAPNQVKFIMPAGSTGVIVEFVKGTAPTYFLQAYRTQNGSHNITELNNKITLASSQTISKFMGSTDVVNSVIPYPLKQTDTVDSVSTAINPEQVPSTTGGTATATGAAHPGEMVTMTFEAADGWYVQSVEVECDNLSYHLEYPLDFQVLPGGGENTGVLGAGKSTLTASFPMPNGDTWFIVNYRQGPRPRVTEYTMSLVVLDDDNTATPLDNNWVKAVSDGAFHHETVQVGRLQSRDVIFPQAGDTVTLTYEIQRGYILDYIVINPEEMGIYPTYVSINIDGNGVTTGEATLEMPASNITVVARIIKADEPRKYTANLILRPPAGVDNMLNVGEGTFLSPTSGTLDDYPTKAVFSILTEAGTNIDIGLYAYDGYYIRAITIDPPTGESATLSGSFGHQKGNFTMPAANVNVNVWFERGWPDEVQYGLKLKVLDPAFDLAAYNDAMSHAIKGLSGDALAAAIAGVEANYNHASFRAPAAANDGVIVHGNESHAVAAAAFDRDTVIVDIHRKSADYYVTPTTANPNTIRVEDANGNPIHWWFTPGNDGDLAIAFTMPPISTTVTIKFLWDDPLDPVDPKEPKYEVKLHSATIDTAAGDSMEMSAGSPLVTKTADGDVINNLRAGDTVSVKATHGTDRHIAAAYAVKRTTGEQLLIPMELVTEGTDAGTGEPVAKFAMPAANADVYLVYKTGAAPDPDDSEDRPMTLIVSGEAGSGSATMTEVKKPANTMSVSAFGADTMFATQKEQVQVTFYPAFGYFIESLYVVRGDGTVLYPKSTPQEPGDSPTTGYSWVSMLPVADSDPQAWAQNRDQQIVLNVPVKGGTVHVRYGKAPDPAKKYTVQVVVNDSQYVSVTNDPKIPSRNNATLRDTVSVTNPTPPPSTIEQQIATRIKEALPGEWIDLDLTVHEGYKIEYIMAVPQDYGVTPILVKSPMDSQSTGFYMPGGDVTVYVKFVPDGLTRYNVTLVATGYRGGNQASITSGYSGTRGPIQPGDPSVTVRAAPDREWVTVDYTWDADSRVESVTVTDQVGNPIPFTQVNPNKLTFPMVSKDVIVTVEYKKDPTPKGYDVILHVIDKDGRKIDWTNRGWAQIKYYEQDNLGHYKDVDGNYIAGGFKLDANLDPTTTPAGVRLAALRSTGKIMPNADGTEGTATIQIPAGKLADLTAFAKKADEYYIDSAYVLYEDGGQMIKMNLEADHPGFSDQKEQTFAVHPGINHVYVRLTKEVPVNDEYSAVLMLKGPADDTGSRAGICVGTNFSSASEKASVTVNGAHGYVTAKKGDTITVVVVPSVGYAIDRILITPLGDTTTYTRVGNTISLTMPARNVAVTVFLKASLEQEYDVWLHYIQNNAKGNSNKGVLSSDGTASAPVTGDHIDTNVVLKDVAEASTVTLDVSVDTGYTVLAAYALRDTVLVPMSPALEGLTKVGDANINGTATFAMPGGDVDVYLVFTDDPPADPNWRTAVLLVTDRNVDPGTGSVQENYGENGANIRGDLTGKTQPPPYQHTETGGGVMGHTFITTWENEEVTVTVEPPKEGYSFALPATITHSVMGVSNPLVERSQSPYVYTYRAGAYNSAVLVRFESAEAVKPPLTVIIEDEDNPGIVPVVSDPTNANGSVTNTVVAAPKDMTALTVNSTTPAGAYEVIPSVAEGTLVSITVKPQKDPVGSANSNYSAYALYDDGSGNDPVKLPLVRGTDGNYTASINMPSRPATVTVRFYRNYNATLKLVERSGSGDQSTQVQMTEDFRGDGVRVSVVNDTNTLYDLPRGTELTASIWDLNTDTSQVTAVLLTVNGSTTLLNASSPQVMDKEQKDTKLVDAYRHTMGRADAEITFIVDAKNTDDAKHFVAAVRTVNLPAGATKPTIASTTAGAVTGSIWTTSDAEADVTVTVKVPQRYKAVVTAKRADGTVEAFTAVTEGVLSSSGAPGGKTDDTATLNYHAANSGTVQFKMPEANVQVTVEYIKVEFDLTLNVVDNSGLNLAEADANTHSVTVTPTAADIIGGTPTTLTYSKVSGAMVLSSPATALMKAGGAVGVTAIAAKKNATAPATGTVPANRIAAMYWQTASGAITWLPIVAPYTDYANANAFDMPADDVTVTVIFAPPEKTPTGSDPKPRDNYRIVTVQTVGTDGLPDNKVESLENRTNGDLPAGSPVWSAGLEGDKIHIAFTAAPGYYVTVTAQTREATPQPVAVVQLGLNGSGTADLVMPAGKDVLVTVTYRTTPPVAQDMKVLLRLVGHNEVNDNKGELSSVAAPAITGISLSGNDAKSTSPVYLEDAGDKTSPVRKHTGKTDAGRLLKVSGDWGSGYRIVRMTVGTLLKPNDPTDYKGKTNPVLNEVDIPFNTYGSNAAARFYVPGEGTVLTLYYANVYTATLHIRGGVTTNLTEGTVADTTEMTDDRAATVTSTGSDPVKKDGDQLLQLQGGDQIAGSAQPGETIKTTAKPGKATDKSDPDPTKWKQEDRLLIGVVYENDLTGATAATRKGTSDEYDFFMPKADTDVYVFYENKPATGEKRSYIAKVAIDPTSDDFALSTAAGENMVSIENTSDKDAQHGKYWTGAKEGETVTITVKLLPGYQAIVISARMDDETKRPLQNTVEATDTKFDYYVTRTRFVVSGKTTSFSMPAETDATVTIKFIKGYTLDLNVSDKSGVTTDAAHKNTVDVAAEVDPTITAPATDPADVRHIQWEKGDAEKYTPDEHKQTGLPSAIDIKTALTLSPTAYLAKVQTRVLYQTPFAGTVTLPQIPPATAGAPDINTYPAYKMPAEDTLETVFYREVKDPDKDDKLLAKVEVKGESDINGNTAPRIIDDSDTNGRAANAGVTGRPAITAGPYTTTGTVWTTTMSDHTIDVAITVAKGYKAKVKVRVDDDDYAANPTDPTKWHFLNAKDYEFIFKLSDASEITYQGVGDESLQEVTLGFYTGRDPILGTNISDTQHFQFTMPKKYGPTPDATRYFDEHDVTVIVEFVYAGTIPAPYDPYHTVPSAEVTPATTPATYIGTHYQGKGMPDPDKVAKLSEGFIYAENRREYALVDIPTLMKEDDNAKLKLYNTDSYDKSTDPKKVATAVTFHFHLYDAVTDVYTELEIGKDIEVVPYDEEDLLNTGDKYNYIDGMYKGIDEISQPKPASGEHNFMGSRFKVIVKKKDDGTPATANAAALDLMLNNEGSLYPKDSDPTKQKPYDLTTKLYVTASSSEGESAYTEVWIRPAYTLAVQVLSYGPSHPIEGRLYQITTLEELKEAYDEQYDKDYPGDPGHTVSAYDPPNVKPDERLFENYHAIATYTDRVEPIPGEDKWVQIVRIRTSELLGDYTTAGNATPSKPVYAMTLHKTSNITYTRVMLVMDTTPDNKCYNPDTKTFSIQDVVTLIAGDATGDNATKWQDYDFIRQYVEGTRRWTTVEEAPTAPKASDYTATADYNAALTAYSKNRSAWMSSVYNPESPAYRCDLNSDGAINVLDLDILTTYANYNKTEQDYKWWVKHIVDSNEVYRWDTPFDFFPPSMADDVAAENVTHLSLGTYITLTDDMQPYPAPYDPIMDAHVIPDELKNDERPETPATREPWFGETAELPKGEEIRPTVDGTEPDTLADLELPDVELPAPRDVILPRRPDWDDEEWSETPAE